MTTARKQPPKAPGSITVREEMKPIELTLRLLTPIFGGGAAIGDVGDPVSPIRGSAIRGQLRFWWRATRGGRFGTLAELRRAEAKLWGAASEPGLVDLAVDASELGRGIPEDVLEDRDGLAYFAFPLQPGSGDTSPPRKVLSYGGTFRLSIRACAMSGGMRDFGIQDPRAELEAALWAWRHFGGVGGRTRRGFGAVSLAEEDRLEPDAWLSAKHIIDACPPFGVPSLAPSSGARLVATTADGARTVWRELAHHYKKYRQGLDLGRNRKPGSPPYGRSRWPEPDYIRHRTHRRNQGARAHRERIVAVDRAPRARLGLPIIFHFRESIDDLTLKLVDRERFASPLVLRPVGTPQRACGVALALGNRPDLDTMGGGVVFAQGNDRFPVATTLSPGEASWRNSPLVVDPRRGSEVEPDPVLAFLKRLENL